MYTAPAKYTAAIVSPETPSRLVVLVATPSKNWFFTNGPALELTYSSAPVRVYGILQEDPEISQSADLFQRQCDIANITLKLDNLAVIDGSTIGQLLTAVERATITIYLMAGTTFTAVEDGLPIFKGQAIKPHAYTIDVCTIEAENYLKGKWPMFPPKFSKVTLPGGYIPSKDYQDEKKLVVPYAAGDHSYLEGTFYDRPGKIRGVGIQDLNAFDLPTGYPFIFWIARGSLASTAAPRLWLKFPEMSSYIELLTGFTIDYAASGYTTVTLAASVTGYIHVFPEGLVDTNYIPTQADILPAQGLNCNTGINNVADAESGKDNDITTYARIFPGTRGRGDLSVGPNGIGGETPRWLAKGQAVYKFEDVCDATFQKFFTIDYSDVKIFYRATKHDIHSPTGDTMSHVIQASPYGTAVHFISNDNSGGPTYTDGLWGSSDFDGSEKSFSIATISGIKLILGGGQARVHFVSYCKGPGGASASSANWPVEQMMDVAEVKMRIKVTIDLSKINSRAELWWDGQGLRLGTTIQGRTGGTATAVTESPTILVEKLLREEMGFSTGDIDTASIDALTNSNIKTRYAMDIDDQQRLDEVIGIIAENANFLFFNDFVGKARLIPISPIDPTNADRVFSLPDLIGLPEMGGTDMETITNLFPMNLDYCRPFFSDNRDFKQTYDLEDSTSQGDFGILTAGGADFIAAKPTSIDASSDDLAKMMVNLFSNPHKLVTIQVARLRGADLEIGDWFSLDPAALDSIMKYYGTSWSGLKFIITSKRIKRGAVELTGLKMTKVYAI